MFFFLGLGYTLNVSGNDGRHPDVVSTVTVVFSVFTNATVENSVILLIPRLTASDFLSIHYRSLRDTLQRDSDSEDIVLIYSIDTRDDNLYIYLAIETPKGSKSKQEVSKLLSKKLNKIKNLLDGKNITIGHSPCDSGPCKNGGSCNDQLIVYDDARITNSQSLILTSSRVVHETICKCQDGFTGVRCDLPQDPCMPSPCFQGGQCHRIGHKFLCSCPSHRVGEYCELEKGDACALNPCKNDGTCKVSPDGSSFFCLCRTGYRGNHCEAIIDSCRPNPCLYGSLCIDQKPGYRCSCPEGRYGRHCERSTFGFDELSFMSFPALDANTNDITIIFATIKPNALLLYNYGPQSSGRSDFIALELINGKISFSCGGTRSAIVKIQVNSGKKLDDGQWKKVTATRNGRVMSLSVSNCREHGDYCDDCEPDDRNCFVDDMGLTSTLNFNSNLLLLGGLINVDPILERSGQVHSDDFVGCIHSVSVNGRALNLSSPISSRGVRNTCPRPEQSLCQKYGSICGSVTKCFDKWHQISCECSDKLLAPNCQGAFEPINLSDGGFIEFKISEKHKRMHLLENIYKGTTLWTENRITRSTEDEINLFQTVYPPKKISLMFKTIEQNGILLYVATNKHYTAIELRNGQLIYFSMLGPIVNMTGSIDESLANGKWHNLTILARSRGIRLLIDKISIGDELDSAGVHDFLDPYLTTLFIGGMRKDLRNSNGFSSNFEGCLSNFTINDEVQPFNGSGSIFKEVVYHGKVYRGCRGLSDISTAAAAAAVTDPLNIGITLVVIFFVTLLVAILVSFVIFKLRQQNKEKMPPSVVNKNTNTIMTNSHGSTTDSMMSRHENTYISDTSELRGVGMGMGIGISMGMGIGVGHLGAEMISKKFKEREIPNEHRSQRPDIIEREVAKNISMREEHPPLPPPTHSSLHSHEHSQELDMPELYDLENASSIAPSDIDIVYHYKSYRDGMRKYKATPLPISSYNHHKHTAQRPHRHNGPFPPRAMLSQSVDQSPGPAPQLLQSTPLARLSPSSELSSQQTRILTLRDISGKPYQSALLATTSSSGGIDKDALHSNSERSLNSPIMSQLSGSTSSRKVPQSSNENGNNISRGPMGLTAEEIERLNSRPRISSLVSTLEAVSSSCDVRRPPPPPHGPHGPIHLHQRHKPPTERLERQNSSTTDESESDSFTCSEIEYDNDSMAGNKCSDNLYSKSDNEQLRRCNESPQSNKHPATNINYDGFDSSFKGSLTTLVASDDDLSTQIGSLYRPNSNGSSSKNTALSGDYLLSWGPNFQSLIGVFIDIAKLPDSAGRVSNGLRLATNIPKTSEEYV